MKHMVQLTALVACLTIAGQAAEAASPVTKAPPAARTRISTDRARIEALERGYVAAFNAKNVNKIMSYYSRQGLFVFDVTPPREYVGWESYKKDWEALFAHYPGPLRRA